MFTLLSYASKSKNTRGFAVPPLVRRWRIPGYGCAGAVRLGGQCRTPGVWLEAEVGADAARLRSAAADDREHVVGFQGGAAESFAVFGELDADEGCGDAFVAGVFVGEELHGHVHVAAGVDVAFVDDWLQLLVDDERFALGAGFSCDEPVPGEFVAAGRAVVLGGVAVA